MPKSFSDFLGEDEDEELDDDLVEDEDEEDDEEEGHQADEEEDDEVEIVNDPNPSRWRTDPATALAEDEVEKDFSKKTQKRINKIRAAAGELQRQRDAERQSKNEAVAYARSLAEENERIQKQLKEHAVQNFTSQFSSADNESSLAQREYEAAALSGDAPAMAKAQQRMTQAEVRKAEATRFKANAEAIKVNPPKQQAAAPQNGEVQWSAESIAWFKKNPWFDPNGRDDLSLDAIKINNKLIQDGYEQGSQEYFQAIDKGIRKMHPEAFGVAAQRKTNTVRSERQSRNTEQRDNGSSNGKLSLTKSQLEQAKAFGMIDPNDPVKTKKALKRYAQEIAKVGRD